MSSNDVMITFQVNVEGHEIQEFEISAALLSPYSELLGGVFDENGIELDGRQLFKLEAVEEKHRLGWRGLFEYLQSGTFTIPQLHPAEIDWPNGDRYHGVRQAEEEIFQAYDLARRFGIADFQNRIMDALYDLGRLTNRHLSPTAMRYVLERNIPNTKMQSYCAQTIDMILSRRDSMRMWTVRRCADLASDFPDLTREIFTCQAEAAFSGLGYPDDRPLIHFYFGYCHFHEHPDGEECYLEDGFRPVDYLDIEAGSEAEVEMKDKGTQTGDFTESVSDEYRVRGFAGDIHGRQAGEEMNGRVESHGRKRNWESADFSSDDSEEVIHLVLAPKYCKRS